MRRRLTVGWSRQTVNLDSKGVLGSIPSLRTKFGGNIYCRQSYLSRYLRQLTTA